MKYFSYLSLRFENNTPMTGFSTHNLFGNPIRERNKEMLKPSIDDHIFLDFILTKTLAKLTDEDKERLSEIENNLDEITEWNQEIDDPDSIDFIDIGSDIDKFNKVKKHLRVQELGGITKFKKENLKKALKNPMTHPANYNWEAEYMFFYPEDYNRKLPKDGGWVMIIEDVPVKLAPEKYDIYYAKPVAKDREVYGDKYKTWKAKIIANDQEMYLLPHEYIIIPDANWLLAEIDKSVEMITLGGTGKLNKNKVFYLKSRGFSQVEVYQILFRSLTSQSFAYFRLLPKVAEYFDLVQEVGSTSMAQAIMAEREREIPTFNFKLNKDA